jgi:RNA polymerase sigma-70 factor (ECF subfamily)
VTRDERFEAEVLPHLRSLFGTAYRMTGNAHDAEDLVQETFLRAHRAFDKFEPGSNARAWLHTILVRVRTDLYRRSKRRPETVELVGDGPGVAAPQDALASGREDLERALLSLPEVFRDAVVLRDVQELSYAEIAAALGVPIGTVMSRIHRGRALLRQALAGRQP